VSTKLSTEELEAELARRKEVGVCLERIARLVRDDASFAVMGVSHKHVRGVGHEVSVMVQDCGKPSSVVVRHADELAAARMALAALLVQVDQ
jgi:hypothetical protein